MGHGPWVEWNQIGLTSTWQWRVVHDSAKKRAPVDFALAPGKHTLAIAYREDARKLDRIKIHAK